ncbi:hypothetical protein [Marinimicrobium sp. C2-29]|uniref:hypothetical protein n=1 Tax=Marinimicrobium sp. C2-29 TaxID=3139825 RepID=UPI003139B664
MKDLKHKPETVVEIQEYLSHLYGEVNKNRDVEYLFSYLFRNVSYLSRSIPRELNCVQNFIKTFSWLFAIANKLEINLQDSYLKKYPDVCPYCIAKPCVCSKTNKKPVSYVMEWKIQEELGFKYNIAKSANPNPSMDSLVESTNDLYPANTHIWKASGPTFHFFRLLEELGEVHEAYTSFCKGTKNRAEIENELADCFAWTLSAWGIYYLGESLQDSFITYYYNSCPVCNSDPCSCEPYSDRGEMLVKIDELRLYREKVAELIKAAPDHNDLLQSILKDLEFAEKQGSTTVAVSAVKQSDSALEKLSGELNHADSSAKSIKSIIGSANAIVQSFNWFS